MGILFHGKNLRKVSMFFIIHLQFETSKNDATESIYSTEYIALKNETRNLSLRTGTIFPYGGVTKEISISITAFCQREESSEK